MDCKKCGTALEFVEDEGFFHCDFCGALHVVVDPEISPDRIVSLGDQDDAICPICAKNLVAAALDNHRVRFCDSCQGILVTNDDFRAIIRQRRSDYRAVPVTPTPMDPRQLDRTIACPECGNAMEAHPYYGPGNAVIDGCETCDLLWFDRGEIAAIEKAPGPRT